MNKRIAKVMAAAVPLFWNISIQASEAANKKGDLFAPFGPGGAGWAITQLLVIAIGGSVSAMLATALGKGNIAAYIKLLTTVGCIGTVINEIRKAAMAVFGMLGY